MDPKLTTIVFTASSKKEDAKIAILCDLEGAQFILSNLPINDQAWIVLDTAIQEVEAKES